LPTDGFPFKRSSPLSRPMKRLRPKETEDAPQSSTQRKSRCHRRAGGEDRGGGRGRHTWPLAGCENRCSGRGHHTWAGSPPANLAGGWCRSKSARRLRPSHSDRTARRPDASLTGAQGRTWLGGTSTPLQNRSGRAARGLLGSSPRPLGERIPHRERACELDAALANYPIRMITQVDRRNRVRPCIGRSPLSR
jgi:hypothetical protein